jgi:hypothetical protein
VPRTGKNLERNAYSAAFGAYLRTGLWRAPDQVELKYNHNHDPHDGRFTFGGGGASGSWGAPANRVLSRKPKSIAVPVVVKRAAPITGAGRSASAEVRTHETRNGYDFALDGAKRTRAVTGTLRLVDAKRSQASQRSAGKPDRLSTDHGGHYIARRFDGPNEAFNHFAQDQNFNVGVYKALENVWANEVRAGRKVTVRITPSYQGKSKRPLSIEVIYFIDGARRRRDFNNAPGGL